MERSAAAKFAASVFYEGFNDFDVYIEDTAQGYAKIFATILSRAMSDTVSLEKVFPLGARVNVVSAAKARLVSSNTRGAVYIVDGDLYLLAGERDALPSNVVILPRYCIENFLVDESTFISIMNEEHCSLSADELARRFDYRGWLERSKESLMSLFRVFGAAHHLEAGVSTVARGYDSVYKGENGELNREKARQTELEVQEYLIAHYGQEAFERALEFVETRVNRDSCFVSTYVSAKDFTLPLMIIRMRAITDCKAKNINLKLRISNRCSVEPFSDVARQIREVVARSNEEHHAAS